MGADYERAALTAPNAKPKRWCAKHRRVEAGPCPDALTGWHRHREKDQTSGRGGRPWQRRRERIFRRDKFLCQAHARAGLLRPVSLHGADAGICDHIKPLAEGGSDEDINLETLCDECSKAKTARESARGRGG